MSSDPRGRLFKIQVTRPHADNSKMVTHTWFQLLWPKICWWHEARHKVKGSNMTHNWTAGESIGRSIFCNCAESAGIIRALFTSQILCHVGVRIAAIFWVSLPNFDPSSARSSGSKEYPKRGLWWVQFKFFFFKFFQGTIRACVRGKLVRLVDIRWCFQPTSLSHPISNRESHRFTFQVFRIGVEMPKLGFKVKDRFAFYLCDYISSRNRVYYWTYRVLVSDFEQILQTHCNTCLFGVDT